MRSGRGSSSYFGSVHSKEDLTPIPETRYIHLQVVSHHDRPSLLPLDSSAFSHHPCSSVCDAQKTSTIWASLSPLCEALILDYLSRNCPIPLPARWQLHSAWPVTQQLSRRGRYLQRALLGSQLLSWQGNFVVVFSALLPRPQSPGDQAGTMSTEQPRKLTIIDSPKGTKPLDAGKKSAKPHPGQELPNEAIGLVDRHPEVKHRTEHATLQGEPSTFPQAVAPDHLLSQQQNANMLQTGPQNPFSDHSSWQLVQRPQSTYPQMPYGSMPYASPYMPSSASTAQAYGPLANMYPSPAGYFQPGSLTPFTGPNPFQPFDQRYPEHPPPDVAHAPAAVYSYPTPPSFDLKQTPAPPTPDYGQWQTPSALPLRTHAEPRLSKREVEPRKKSVTSISHRDSRNKSDDDTSYSSSSGPESIYPLRTSETSRPTLPIPHHHNSSSSRTVTFSDNTTTGPRSQEAGSAARRSSSRRHSRSSDGWKAAHLPSSATRVHPPSAGNRARSPVKPVESSSSSDSDNSETFDDMLTEYMGSDRNFTTREASVRSQDGNRTNV
jgi:hypothetical protein